jgi:hypothetical protein
MEMKQARVVEIRGSRKNNLRGLPLGNVGYPKRAQKLGVGLNNFVGVGSMYPKGR